MDFHTVLVDFITAVEPAVVVLVGALVSMLILKINEWLKNHMSDQDYKMALTFVEGAVKFVEQTQVGQTGAEKKTEAMRVLDEKLADYGLPFTAEELEKELEAAVYEHTATKANGKEVVAKTS